MKVSESFYVDCADVHVHWAGKNAVSYEEKAVNFLKPNDIYICRTAALTPDATFYIFIQQIYILNILNMLHNLLFFTSK